MCQLHKLKLDIAYCDAVLNGDKNFEIRYNDRGYQKGDIIEFIAVKDGRSITHDINNRTYKITYVINGYGLKDNWVVFGIKKTDITNTDFKE